MGNSKIADTNELLELFSKIEFSDDDKKLRQNLVKVAKYYCNNPRHQYHVISRFIYEKMKSGDDAIEFMLAGATAVSIGTGNFISPEVSVDAVKGIEDYMRKYGIEDINEIIGKVQMN